MVIPVQTETKNKQNYLKEEVLEKGYDGEAFAEFLDSQRPDGASIENWTLAELELMVELFKRSLDVKEAHSKYKLQDVDLMDEDDEIYCKRVKCQKRDINMLGDGQIKVEVKQWEIVDGGFFTGKYALFHVETNLTKSKAIIKRKSWDFLWLRDMLARDFQGYFIPATLKTIEKGLDDVTLGVQAAAFNVAK